MSKLFKGINKIAKDTFEVSKENGYYKNEVSIKSELNGIQQEVNEARLALSSAKIANVKITDSTICVKTQYHKDRFERVVKDTLEDELADIIMRTLSLCHNHNIDIEKHLELKHNYNKVRFKD